MVITIDGPVAAGKTTAAHGLAARLRLALLDTGAIYRCVAQEARNRDLDWLDEAAMTRVAQELAIEFRMEDGHNRVFLAETDVTALIRRPEISQGASIVSALPGVRMGLLSVQRRQATKGALVVEGRDTGTVVFPEAEIKFFLTADPEIRAMRRFLELERKGVKAALQDVLDDLQERDHRDSTRPIAPLVPAENATTIDSSDRTADEVITTMYDRVSDQLELGHP